ncbi:MAG: transcriptional regulator [Pseudolabrys sp.]
MAKNPNEAQDRANAKFKKETQAREGAQAMLEYEAAGKAMRAKTERLKALRLAKEAAEAAADAAAPKAVPAKKKKPANTAKTK